EGDELPGRRRGSGLEAGPRARAGRRRDRRERAARAGCGHAGRQLDSARPPALESRMNRNPTRPQELALPIASLAALRNALIDAVGEDAAAAALRAAGHAAGDALHA